MKGDAASDLPYEPGREKVVKGLGPSYATFNTIPHYYGDATRGLLLGAATLLLISSPLYADAISTQFIFIVFGAIVTVIAAAFTDPHKRASLMADAVVGGVGLAVYAGWGLMGYSAINPVSLVLRLAIALIFLFAFYFSLKTVRAFALHEIGKEDDFSKVEENGVGENS